MRAFWLIILTTALSIPAANAAQLRIAVASNFAAVLKLISNEFTATTGHTILISAASTGTHFAQISNGAPFDIFLAADLEHPALLEHSGLAVPGSQLTYAQGKLLLWSSSPTLVDADGKVLYSSNFRHLAIANPEQAPYGLAARQVLTKLNLWPQLQTKLVQGENITQTLQFIQSGNAQLGFIAASQWAGGPLAGTGSAWEVPAELYAPILQGAVMLTDSEPAHAFMSYLTSTPAQQIISDFGYLVP